MEQAAQLTDYHPESHNVRIRDSVNVIATFGYYVHMVVSMLYAILLMILEKKVQQKSITMIVILVYGLLPGWGYLVTCLLVALGKPEYGIWWNRFIMKIIITLFPIFCLICWGEAQFLHLRSVTVFMIYYTVIAVILIIYELYACSYGHHEQPSFIFRPNELTEHSRHIYQEREQYWRMKRSST